jgi:hypothetical protein
MDLVTEDRRAKKYITDIKFHKGGKDVGGEGIEGVFALLSQDGKIYIHETVSYRILRMIRYCTLFSVCIYEYILMYIYIHIFIYMYIDTYIKMFTYTFFYPYFFIHICLYIYKYYDYFSVPSNSRGLTILDIYAYRYIY